MKSHFSFPPRDHYRLLAAEGWLELGNHLEANAELDEITPTLRGHPCLQRLVRHSSSMLPIEKMATR